MTQTMWTTCELYRANPLQAHRPIRELQMYRPSLSIGDALVNSVHSQMTYRTHQQESQQNGTKTWDKSQTWTDKNGSDRMDLQLHIQDINIQMGPQGAGQTNIKQTNRNQIFTDPSVHISLHTREVF